MRFEDPLGAGTRPRLSEQETETRMYDAALRMVQEQGLRVNFTLLRFEDVITDAGVSRSAAYKRWPSKDQFFCEILLKLAHDDRPASDSSPVGGISIGAIQAVAHAGLANLDWLTGPDGARRLLIELCRIGGAENFSVLHGSRYWQIYSALHATVVSLPENDFQLAMREALIQTENGFLDQISGVYESLFTALGHRLVPGMTYRAVSALGGAAMQGLVISVPTNPQMATETFELDPFRTGDRRTWTYAGLSLAALLGALVEPDPEVVWNPERLEGVRLFLEALAELDAQGLAVPPDRSSTA